MHALWSLINFLVFIQIATCRDFYLGMFRRNDFLVAQDVIYKPPSPFGCTTANYGRLFKCPITYFRVVDRLGMGRGPITTIVRGGLRKKFITVRIKSTYKLPISVNIYVGCENKNPTGLVRTTSTSDGADDVTEVGEGDATTDDQTKSDDGNTADAETTSDTTGDESAKGDTGETNAEEPNAEGATPAVGGTTAEDGATVEEAATTE